MKTDKIELIFDQVASKVASNKKDIAPIKPLLDSIDFREKTVLEAGCGLGDNLIYCYEKGAKYVEGFDISGKSISLARAKCPKNEYIKFEKCSIEEYETQHKFDIILALGVFEYFSNPFRSLKKLVCLLNNNGTMVLLISKPIFIKKVSFLARAVLSKLPLRLHLPIAISFGKFMSTLELVFKQQLYYGKSRTYTLHQTLLEGVFVPRYNLFRHDLFMNCLLEKGFSVNIRNDVPTSMICLVAERKNS